jgi:hypothetical protein
VQKVDQLAPLMLPSGGTDGLTRSAAAGLVPSEVNLAELLKFNSLTSQPAVECRRVPRLDVDDSESVLLAN